MTPRIWLLYLAIPGRYGRWLTAVLLFCLLYALFSWLESSAEDAFGSLFFSAMLAYIIPVYGYITRLSTQAVAALRPVLTLDDTELDDFIRSIDHQGIGWQLGVALLGVAGGLVQLGVVASNTDSQVIATYKDGIMPGVSLGSFMVWIVMTTVMFSLVQNATRIGRLAHQLQPIDLYRHDRLLPFARVAIASSLPILGSLALFPLLFIDERATWTSSAPGMTAIALPLVALLFLPIAPAHRAIQAAKADAIGRINRQIDACRGAGNDDLAALNTLLDHRAHLVHVPDWPLDTGNLGRLALYVLIPPLTWVGAALIENVVDALL